MYSSAVGVGGSVPLANAPYAVSYPHGTVNFDASPASYAPPAPVPMLVSNTRVANRGLSSDNGPPTAAATSHFGYGVMPEKEEQVEQQLGIDAPSFRSLSGLIIALLLVMTTLSLFICLGRTDFNIIFYFMGYYIWCLESEAVDTAPFSLRGVIDRGTFLPPSQRDEYSMSSFEPSWSTYYLCTRRMYRAVQQYSIALIVASVIDISWILLAFSTWMCENIDHNSPATRLLSDDDPIQAVQEYTSRTWCFTGENARMGLIFGMHQFVLFSSMANLFLKILVIILSFVWLSSEKKYLYADSSRTFH